MTVEQINNTIGTLTYLHHDQAGSTRLLTGSMGTVTGSTTAVNRLKLDMDGTTLHEGSQ